MSSPVIAIISPGDMGHVVGGVLNQRGFKTITALEGRSDLSRIRAERAMISDVGHIKNLISEANILLSIMPPQHAIDLAYKVSKQILNEGGNIIFADCNAIAPATTIKIKKLMDQAQIPFVKIGIIGPPPRAGVETRFYSSGPDAYRLSELGGEGILYKIVSEDIVAAAALKMCYAGLTKCTMTLQIAVLVASEILGVREELSRELEASQKFHWNLMTSRVPFYAADADRWASEMHEIAQTLGGVGLTRNLHEGARDIFRLMASSPLGDETRETLDKSRTLGDTIRIFSEMVEKEKWPKA